MTVADLPPLLSVEDVRELSQTRTKRDRLAEARDVASRYSYVKPVELAAEGLIEVLSNSEGRYSLGIPELDIAMRGIGRGELVMLTGRAHSGKTQVVLNSIVNNPTRRTIVFTPDEVAELVFAKLHSIRTGIPAEEIERKIKEGDTATIESLRRSAAKDFANLIVIDQTLTFKQMTDALNEAQDYWGEQCDLAVVDYLELIPGGDGDGESVIAKAQGVKRWAKSADVPLICLHQAGRSSGQRGQAAGLNAMRFGGEAEATFVIECYRKREDETLDDFDRRRHANTLTLNLCKSKRPGSKLSQFDVYLDPSCGHIRMLQPDDMVATGVPVSTIEEALKARG